MNSPLSHGYDSVTNLRWHWRGRTSLWRLPRSLSDEEPHYRLLSAAHCRDAKCDGDCDGGYDCDLSIWTSAVLHGFHVPHDHCALQLRSEQDRVTGVDSHYDATSDDGCGACAHGGSYSSY